MALTSPEMRLAVGTPDRLVMMHPDIDDTDARRLAIDATFRARQVMPRVSGRTASRLQPFYGRGFFGIWFPDSHTWFMEQGTGPRTMRTLAGKTIPMWITDTDGSLRRGNPKAKVRTTDDGRTQVLIFRRAARIGQRKTVRKVDRVTGAVTTSSTPASYPGAPGRISRRAAPMPWTPVGQRGGQIGAGNVGVRWRHPGLRAQQFMNTAITGAAFDAGLIAQTIYVVDGGSWELALTRKRASTSI
jgi:hypothetical protein